jgi:IS5 family transposase
MRSPAKSEPACRSSFSGVPKFGQGKRRFRLGLMREKLTVTQRSAIAMTILAMNIEKLLQLLFILRALWLEIMGSHNRAQRGHNLPQSMHAAAA